MCFSAAGKHCDVLFILLIKNFFHILLPNTHKHTHTHTHTHIDQPAASIQSSSTMFLIRKWTKRVPNNQHTLSQMLHNQTPEGREV